MNRRKGYSSYIPQLPGVYKLTNLVNKKVYIGKSVRLRHRIQGHGCDSRFDYYIKRAIRKHGWENFKIDLLEVYPKRTPFIEKYILEREGFWISFFRSNNKNIGYNTAVPASSREGFHLSESHRKALREAHKRRRESPEYIENQKIRQQKKTEEKERRKREKVPIKSPCGPNSPNWGKKRSKETILKMKESASKVVRASIRPSYYKKIDQICSATGKVLKTWDSISQAASSLKISMSFLSSCLNGYRKSSNYRWEYHSKIILICGLSGAGKTSLAKTIVSAFPLFKHINGDEIRKKTKNYDFSINGRIKQSKSLKTACQKAGDFILCDSISPTKQTRKNIKPDAIIFINNPSRCIYQDTFECFESPSVDEAKMFLKINGNFEEKIQEISLFIEKFLIEQAHLYSEG